MKFAVAMKNSIVPVSLVLLSSCAFHIHEHEVVDSPSMDGAIATGRNAPWQSETPSNSWGGQYVSGVVVDEVGSPLKADMHLIYDGGGSMGRLTRQDGTFEFNDVRGSCTVIADTEDGKFAVLSGISPTEREVQLQPQPGATVWVEVKGQPSGRIAAFYDTVRIADYSIRPGRSRYVLPEGEVRVIFYSGDEIFREQQLKLTAGEVRDLNLEFPSS